MKIQELLEYSVLDHRPNHIYRNVKQALQQAEKRGMKVTWSQGHYYKVVPMDYDGPALAYNTDRPKQVAELQKQVEFLELGLQAYRTNKPLYKAQYYRKYGLPKAIQARIAQLKRDMQDVPYAVEVAMLESDLDMPPQQPTITRDPKTGKMIYSKKQSDMAMPVIPGTQDTMGIEPEKGPAKIRGKDLDKAPWDIRTRYNATRT